MSSLSTRQSIALLAVIGGSLSRINDCRMFSVVSMKKMVADTYKTVIKIMDSWPEDSHSIKDAEWINKRVDDWGHFLHDIKDHHNLPVFATVCSRCLDDLRTMIRNKKKLQMLDQIEEPIQKILNFIDPNLENVPAFEKANLIMDHLYELIEWRW